MRWGDGAHHDGGHVNDPKSRSSDQSQDHQTVFNVIAGLQSVIPEVECFSDVPTEAHQ